LSASHRRQLAIHSSQLRVNLGRRQPRSQSRPARRLLLRKPTIRVPRVDRRQGPAKGELSGTRHAPVSKSQISRHTLQKANATVPPPSWARISNTAWNRDVCQRFLPIMVLPRAKRSGQVGDWHQRCRLGWTAARFTISITVFLLIPTLRPIKR